MEKINYKKELKEFYHASAKKVVEVDVPEMNFLLIDGQGDPSTSPEFQDAIATLYPVAYTLKFTIKKSNAGVDYGVMPLEGLWWAEDMSAFTSGKRDEWQWTLMIMQPEFVTRALFEQAIDQAREKKNPAALSKLRFESFGEGPAAQIMHIGPFSEEGPSVEKVHLHIEESGRQL